MQKEAKELEKTSKFAGSGSAQENINAERSYA